MTRNALIITAIMCLWTGEVLSQEDSTRYIFGLPVSEDDTVRQFPANDQPPINKLKAVDQKELPEALRKVLDRKDQYKGWQDSTIYFQKNTGLYLVPIRYDKGVKIFGLDARGNPVTYDEVSP